MYVSASVIDMKRMHFQSLTSEHIFKSSVHLIHAKGRSHRPPCPQITASPRSQIKSSTGAWEFDETPALREAVSTYQQASKMAAAQTRHDLLQAESFLEPASADQPATEPSSREALEAFWLEMGLTARASARLTQQLLSDHQKSLSSDFSPTSYSLTAPLPLPHQGNPAASGTAGPAENTSSVSSSSLQTAPQEPAQSQPGLQQPAESQPVFSSISIPQPDEHNHNSISSKPTTENVQPTNNPRLHNHHPPTVSRLSALLQRWQRVLPGADIASLVATDSRLLDCDPCRAINNIVTIIACLPGAEPLSVIAAHVPILWAPDLQERILRTASRLMDLHPSHDMNVVCGILAENPGLLWRLDYYPNARLLDELPMEVQNVMVVGHSGLGYLYRHYANKNKRESK